jgi:PAS domain S-box-containing protein
VIQPLRVLFIDDSADDVELMLRELRGSGFDPTWVRVETPTTLVTALSSQTWDLVLAEHRVPGLDVPSALTLLAAHQPETALIVVSDVIGEDAAAESMRAGTESCLSKAHLRCLGPSVARELQAAAERRARRQAEEALRASEGRYRQMIETANEGARAEERYRRLIELLPDTIYFHQDGRICYINPAGARLLGAQTTDELIGQPFIDRVHPKDREVVQARARQVIEGRTTVPPLVEKLLRLDGSTVDAEVTATHFIHEGRPATLVVVHDITDRVRNERQIRLQRDLALGLATAETLDAALQLCLDAALQVPGLDAGGIYLVDPERAYLELVALSGLSPTFAWVGQCLGADTPHWRAMMAGAPIFCPVQELQAIPRERTQREGLRYFAAVPIVHQGRVIGSFNMGSRTTDALPGSSQRLLEAISAQIGEVIVRLQTQEKLRQSQADLQSLFDSVQDLVFVLDLEGRVVRINRAVTELLGIRDEDVVGSLLMGMHPNEAMPAMPGVMAAIQRADQQATWQMPVMTKTRGVMHVEIAMTAGRWGGRDVLFAVGRDITQRVRAERMIQETLAELQRSNADLEQFAYAASHDLQEPLRMVASFVQLLAERYRGQLDADADDFIGFAVEGAKRMQSLILDLLEYSRVNRFGNPPEPTDSEKLLAWTLRDLELRIAETGATITHDPLPVVWVDPVQFGQVLQNLIGNALKFHGAEPPRVHISARRVGGEAKRERVGERKGEDGSGLPFAHSSTLPLLSCWQFSVRDNGIGIAPEYAEQVFGIFRRLHSRDAYPGTGIGLALCKRIVERHGGRIWVESTPGQDTMFMFTLPAQS